MDKKKIGLIVVILFFLIGLGSFVFANPDEKENLKEGEGTEQVEGNGEDSDGNDSGSQDLDELDSVTDTDNDDTNNDGVRTDGNNQTTPVRTPGNITTTPGGNDGNGGNGSESGQGSIDDGYAQALEAVEKAESSFTQDDVDNAAALVDKVTSSIGKEELQNRLDAVQDAIDAGKIVAELENKVNSSNSINDMNGARDYREETKVEDVVLNLKDSALKEELEQRLETVGKILNDNKSPVITGINDNSFTRTDVTLTIEDANDVTIEVTLNGEEIEYTGSFTKEGTYVVTVVDAAFNETTVTFTVDKTMPKVSGAENGAYYRQDVTITIDEENIQNAKYKKDDGKWVSFDSGYVFTEDGTYTIRVTDKAYNKKAELTFTIDKTNPVITGIEDGKYYRQDVVFDIDDENPGTIHLHKDGQLVKNYKLGTPLTEDGKYSVYVSDKAGNKSTTIEFVIDKTMPVVTGAENGAYYNHDVTLTIIEENIQNAKYQYNGKWYSFKSGKTFSDEGTYFVRVTDKAYNKKAELTFTIDKTNPEVLSLTQEYQDKENGRIKVTITTSEEVSGDSFHDYGWRKAGENTYVNYFYRSGEETITFVDNAGNSGTYTFLVDKTVPEVLSLTQEYQDKENGRIKVTITTSEEVSGDSFHDYGWRKVGENTYVNYFYRSGEETIIFTDQVGNPNTYTFTVDKTAPVVTVTKSNNDKSTNQNVIVTLTSEEAIVVEAGWTKISDTVYTREYAKNGKYSVVVTDAIGNPTTVNFEVKRIDKVAPTATVTKSNNDKSTNQDVVVTLVSNEAIYKPEGWTEVSTNKEHEFTKTYSENGKYSVEITDKAGNTTTINFEVKRIDKVAPEIKVVDPNKYYLEAGEAYVEKGYSAYDVVDKDVTHLVQISYRFLAAGSSNWKDVSTLDTTKLGEYKIVYTAYDKAGNTAKGTRVVAIRDTQAPKFIGLEDGGVYNPATIQVDDATLETISVYFENEDKTVQVENGYVLDEAGNYEITAIDQKNHKTTINIKVDTTVPTYSFNDGTVEYQNVYSKLNLKFYDENGIASVVINGTQLPHTGYYVDINDGDAYTFQNGVNTVVVTDAASNQVTYTFIVDKTAPTYTFNGGTTENNGVYGTLNLKLHDENGIASVVINGIQLPHTGYYVDINDGDAYTFQNGVNTVVATDNLGNQATYTFVVDKAAPTYSISAGTIENNGVYENLNLKLHDENGIASVVINGTQLLHTGYYVDINDGHAYTFQNGVNTVVVTDTFGNSETYNFNVNKTVVE